MGAHTALPTRTVGRLAGRGALTIATALALTGGTASVAFAGDAPDVKGEHTDSCDSSCGATGWGDDHDHGWKSDEDCDDRGKDGHDQDDHDGWGDDHHGKRHHEDSDDHGGKHSKRDENVGARYDRSIHNGDDYYLTEQKTGLLSTLL